MIFTKLPFMPDLYGWAWLILSLLALGAKPLGDPSSLRFPDPIFDPPKPGGAKIGGSTISSTSYIPSTSFQTVRTNSPPQYSPWAPVSDIHGIGLTKSSNGLDSISDIKKPTKRNALSRVFTSMFTNAQRNLRRVLDYNPHPFCEMSISRVILRSGQRLSMLPNLWTARPPELASPPLLLPTRTIHVHIAATRTSVDLAPAPPTTEHGWYKNQVLKSVWLNRYALGCWLFTFSLSVLAGVCRLKKSSYSSYIDPKTALVSECDPATPTLSLGTPISPTRPISTAAIVSIVSAAPTIALPPLSPPRFSPTAASSVVPPFHLGSPIQLATPTLDDYPTPWIRPPVSDFDFYHWIDGNARAHKSINAYFLDLSERVEVKMQLAAHLIIPGQRRLPVFYRSDNSFIERYMMDDFLELGIKWAFGEAQKAVQRYHPDAGDLGAAIDVCVRVTSAAFDVESKMVYKEGFVAEWPLSLDVDTHEYAFCISVQVPPSASTPVSQTGSIEPLEQPFDDAKAISPDTTAVDDMGVVLGPTNLRPPLFSSTYDSRPSQLLLPDPDEYESQPMESNKPSDIDLFPLANGTSDEAYEPSTPPRRSWQSFEHYDAFEYEPSAEFTTTPLTTAIDY